MLRSLGPLVSRCLSARTSGDHGIRCPSALENVERTYFSMFTDDRVLQTGKRTQSPPLNLVRQ